MAPAIPEGSKVLVTGINGYIGSHVADQLLGNGYRVRGTTRHMSKVEGLKSLWEKKFGPDKVEFLEVQDMSRSGAFDEAVKGVSGIAHVAGDMSFDRDPNKVIPICVAGVNEIMKSAASEPSVQRFVYTSSSTAASRPYPNREFTIDVTTWNERDIKEAWGPPPYEAERALAVYCASKAESERALWKFMEERKPHFIANAVLPNTNFGLILDPHRPASTADWIKSLYDGDITAVKALPPQYFVDVQDTARLHVAALINPKVQNERIFAFAEPFNWNDIMKILRELRPNHKFVDDFTDDSIRDRSKVPTERGAELLGMIGRPGWTNLKESIENNIQGL